MRHGTYSKQFNSSAHELYVFSVKQKSVLQLRQSLGVRLQMNPSLSLLVIGQD